MGGAAPPWRFCRSAHVQTQAPRSWGLLLPQGTAEVFVKYISVCIWVKACVLFLKYIYSYLRSSVPTPAGQKGIEKPSISKASLKSSVEATKECVRPA